LQLEFGFRFFSQTMVSMVDRSAQTCVTMF